MAEKKKATAAPAEGKPLAEAVHALAEPQLRHRRRKRRALVESKRANGDKRMRREKAGKPRLLGRPRV